MSKRIIVLLLIISNSFLLKSQNVIFNEGFENATTTSYTSSSNTLAGLNSWEYYQTYNGRLRFTAGTAFYHGGSKAATLDASTSGTYSLNQITKTVDLTSYLSSTDLALSFYYMSHDDETHSDDVVSIRASNSSSWYDIYSLRPGSQTSGSWVYVSLDLDSIIKAKSIVPTSTFQIRFGQYDNYYASNTTGTDGITFDDIVLTGTPIKGLDIALSSIDSPVVWKKGYNSLSISYQNRGKDTISYVSLGYQLDANTPVKVDSFLTGALISGGLKTYTFIQKVPVTKRMHSLKVWANKPNGALPDSNIYNDTLSTALYTCMVDTYYIDSSGKGDFLTFNDAVTRLNAVGLCGPVTFVVRKGTYVERVEISQITNVSKTNTVTFVGEDKKTCILEYTGISSSKRSTVVLNGAAYIRFNNLTIKNNGTTYGTGFLLTNKTKYITIDNCIIDIYKGSNNYLTGINITSTEGSYNSSGQNAYHVSISNNQIVGGMNGFFCYGEHRDTNAYLVVENNKFTKQYANGVYYGYVRGTKIIGNSIVDMNYTDAYGLNTYYSTLDTIINNVIQPGYIGIYMSYHNQSLSSSLYYKSLIANNMISNFIRADYQLGIYLYYYCYNINVFHNTVWVDGTTSSQSNAAFYAYRYPRYTNVLNNIFIASNNSYVMSLYYPYDLSLDYNDYVYPTSGYHFYKNTSITDLSSFKSNTNYVTTDANSYDNKNPYLVSQSDLHLDLTKVNNLYGTNTGLKYDIDGEYRNVSKPVLGADEYRFEGLNIALANIVSPTVWSPGTTDLKITYQNRGADTIGYISLGYQLNADSIYRIDSLPTGVLTIGKTKTYTFSKKMNIKNGRNELKVWASKPNGVYPDSNQLDDTLFITAFTSLIDTYYIDKSGKGDFLSFTDAINTAKSVGVAGHVVFMVEPGTYTERLEIPHIKYTGANSTISFVGVNKSTVILSHTGTSSSDRSTIVLDGADYIRFKNMTIENKGTSYGTGILFMGRAEHNKVEGCSIDITAGVSSYYLVGINASLVETSYSSGGANGYYNEIVNNNFIGGNCGIYWTGISYDTNNYLVVENNEFTKQYYASIFLRYLQGSKLKGNHIHSSYTSTSYGIYAYYSSLDTIINNTINPGQYGIYLYRNNQSLSTSSYYKTLIANNMISDFSNFNNQSGIILDYYCYNINVFHNTIWVDGGTSSYSGTVALYAYYYPRYSNIYNNIFIASNNAYALSMYYPYDLSVDYNTYVYPSSGYHFYKNGSITNLTNLKANTAYNSTDANSYDNVNPYIISKSDLHLDPSKTRQLFGYQIGLNYDVDGDLRNVVKPTLGADEQEFKGLDIAFVDVDSPSPWVKGNNTLKITYANYGADTINYISIGYQLDTGSFKIDSLPIGSLTKGKTGQYTFPNSLYVTKGRHNFKTWVSAPNGVHQDSIPSNDTFSTVLYTVLEDTLYIDSSGAGDFISFTQAVDAIKQFGTSGPVVFIVRKGTYNERITLEQYPGVTKSSDIQFVGVDRSKVILTYAGTSSSDRSTVVFDGADYISFRNMTIKNTGTSYGTCVFFMNQADSNSIDNCILEVYKGSNSYLICVNASLNESSYNGTGSNGYFNRFTNNDIVGGYSGICWAGYNQDSSTMLVVENNDFSYQYSSGIYLNYGRGAKISGNYYHDMTDVSGMGIYSYYSSMDTIVGNKINPGQYGIYCYRHNYSISSNSLYKSLFANNMISNFSNSSYNVGIVLYYYGRNTNVYHNSIWVEGSTSSYSSNTGIYVYRYPYYSSIKNNMIYASNSAMAISLYYPYSLDLDQNLYYYPSTTSTYKFYLNNYYYDFSSFQGNTSYVTHDANSIDNKDPYFKSRYDLHLDETKLNQNWGTSVGLKYDFDGDIRCSNNSYLGADEFNSAVDLYVSDTLMDFGTTMEKVLYVDTLNIMNGNCEDTLLIYSITSSNPAFSISYTSGTVFPGNVLLNEVKFKSSIIGVFEDTLTIKTNYDTVQVVLKAKNIYKPELIYYPNPIKAQITSCGDSVTIPVVFKNIGNSTLDIDIKRNVGGTSGKIKVLAYTYGADLSNEYANTLSAINAYFTNYNLTTLSSTSANDLKNSLNGIDVLFFPEQESGSTTHYTSFAPVIKSFVSQGGVVIYCGSSSSYADRIVSSGIFTGSYASSNGTVYTYNSTHALGQNLSSSWSGANATFFYNFTNSNVVKIAGSSSSHVISYVPYGGGVAIYVGFDFYNYSTNESRAISNAFDWVGGFSSSWISYSDYSDTLAINDSMVLNIKFNSKNLEGGTYQHAMSINTNDPLVGDTIWCYLDYIVPPQISMSKHLFDFGTITNYTFRTDSFEIINNGCTKLDITSITSGYTVYTIFPDNFTIYPGDSQKVYVDFFPLYSGTFDDTIRIKGNLDTFIIVKGKGAPPSEIHTNPNSINATISSCNDSLQIDIYTANYGGADLVIYDMYDSIPGLSGSYFHDDFDAGYYNSTLWYSTSGSLSSSCGTYNGSYALYFSSSSTRYAITNAIDATRLISISFYMKYGTGSSPCESLDSGEEVELYYSTNGGTTWKLINTYNTQTYSYFTQVVEVLPTAARQMNTMFKWEQISHSGSSYDHWSIDEVVFNGKKNTSDSWLNVSSVQDTIFGGDSVKYTVWINASGQTQGTHTGYIMIRSNANNYPSYSIPCTLTVITTPKIVTGVNAIKMDSTNQLYTSTKSFYVSNYGCDTLYISKVYTKTKEFQVNKSLLILPPGDSSLLTVSFKPSSVGLFNDSIYIKSNDKNIAIYVEGVGVLGPQIDVNPKKLYTNLSTCYNIAVLPFKIENTGDVTLFYSIDPASLPSWLTLNAYSGQVASGQIEVVSAIYSVKNLTPGFYSATIKINSNDSSNSKANLTFEVDVVTILGNRINLGNDTSICKNDNFILDAGANYSSYLWSTGDNGRKLVPAKSGTYVVIATDFNGCMYSDTIEMIVNDIPTAIIKVNDTAQCFNGHTFLFQTKSTMQNGSIAAWRWEVDEEDVFVNLDSFAYVFPMDDQYEVKLLVRAQNGCWDSAIQNVYVYPNPVVNLGADKTISVKDTLVLDAGAGFESYLWQNGSTGQTYMVAGSVVGVGSYIYSVKVRNGYSCFASDTIVINVQKDPVGIYEEAISQLKIYPNPTKEYFIVEIERSSFEPVQLELISGDGRLILNKVMDSNTKDFSEKINLNNISKGIYFIKVTSGKYQTYQKLMVR